MCIRDRAYSLVNLEDKTIVGSGILGDAKSDDEALRNAVQNYLDALKGKGAIDNGVSAEDIAANPENVTPEETTSTVSGEITDIRSAVLNGNTCYYLKVGETYYYINAVDDMSVVLLNKGDKVTVTFDKNAKGEHIKANSIKK